MIRIVGGRDELAVWFIEGGRPIENMLDYMPVDLDR
jgi:hypothetical protein